jgi:hypothetical protein
LPQIVIERYKAVARFGLMHCISSSICFWLWSIIRETVDSIYSSSSKTSGGYKAYDSGFNAAGGLGGYPQVVKYVPIINTLSAGLPVPDSPITALPYAAKKQGLYSGTESTTRIISHKSQH